MLQYPSGSKVNYIDIHLKESAPSDEEGCPICKVEWDASTKELVSCHCGHAFHRNCITSWFDTDTNTCPSCRAKCFPLENEMLNPTLDPRATLFEDIGAVLRPFVTEAQENVTANRTDQLRHREVFNLFLENGVSFFLGSQLGRDTLLSEDAIRAYLISMFLDGLRYYAFTDVGARASELQMAHIEEAFRNSPSDFERYFLRSL